MLLTTLRRLVPPLSPLAHVARGDPVKADQRRPRQGKTDADEVATAYPRLVVTEW